MKSSEKKVLRHIVKKQKLGPDTADTEGISALLPNFKLLKDTDGFW
jgi:hypothetical protein